MAFYTIGSSVTSFNQYVRIIGILVGQPESEFVMGQNRWTIHIMQSDNEALVIKYTSHSAEQDLHLRRLERYSGTIIYMTMIELSGLKQFGYAELHFCAEHLVIQPLEHESLTKINEFLKVITKFDLSRVLDLSRRQPFQSVTN